MTLIGFSTGSLAPGDLVRGLALIRGAGLRAVELSALRESELDPLLEFLGTEALAEFEYVAVHAPSHRRTLSEGELVEKLVVGTRDYPVIVHPDIVEDRATWVPLGRRLCFENMDQRKRAGRTATELRSFFRDLPDARFCLDLAHAAQVDPTMSEARRLLEEFRHRLIQLHVSTLDTGCDHRPLSLPSAWAFKSILGSVGHVPWILEGVVNEQELRPEVQFACGMVP
jgi:hypothetical protein